MYSVEEFDNAKTKVVKYISYKKRTEQQIRQKFANSIDNNLLDDIIQYLKEIEYIDDTKYIEKVICELMKLNNLSIKELENKLYSKGFKKDLVQDYLSDIKDDLIDYEINSAKNLIIKKSTIPAKKRVLYR